MMEIGRMNKLKAGRAVEFGMFLTDETDKEVLLPRRYVPEGMEIGAELDVFVYRDSEGRLTATTDTPTAMLDEFACLEVVTVSSAGAFLSWGLAKDLFVPFAEQRGRMELGKSYFVRICLDEETDRLFASNILGDFVCEFAEGYAEDDEVDLIVAEKTDLGYKVVVDEGCWGLLYDEEVFTKLEIGQKLTGYIKKLRTDTRLDVCLQKTGYDRISDVEQRILQALEANDGFLALNSKSAPELIYDTFGVSKKAFKMGVSALYRKRLITLGEGLRINPDPEGSVVEAADGKGEAPKQAAKKAPKKAAKKAAKQAPTQAPKQVEVDVDVEPPKQEKKQGLRQERKDLTEEERRDPWGNAKKIAKND